jgi:hypothetical protein
MITRSRKTAMVTALVTFVLTVVSLALNHTHAIPPKATEAWQMGYWLWAGTSPVSTEYKPEILYVETPGRRWRRDLPGAGTYVAVRRLEPSARLTPDLASALVEDYKAIVADSEGARIAGLQIDYDCPTHQLDLYGRFLKQVRRSLPAGSRLSITALLDWFRKRTDVGDVLESVDEFVPQFYDAGTGRASSGIAEPIDMQKWASVFNSYQVPYRLGLSSFGRIARRRMDPSGGNTIRFFRDASVLDFAGKPGFSSSASTNSAGERVVRYQVHESIPDKPELLPGDEIVATLPTQASVRAAYEAARSFGGYCAGIIFFRWPDRSETLALGPDDVRRIVNGETLSAQTKLEVVPQKCMKRACSDLYLDIDGTDVTVDRPMAVRAIGPVEVFLPGGPLHPVGSGPNRIMFKIPAYSGSERIYLGRTISTAPVRFEVTPQ